MLIHKKWFNNDDDITFAYTRLLDTTTTTTTTTNSTATTTITNNNNNGNNTYIFQNFLNNYYNDFCWFLICVLERSTLNSSSGSDMNIDRKWAGSATALSDSRIISAVVKSSPTHRPPTIKEHYHIWWW